MEKFIQFLLIGILGIVVSSSAHSKFNDYSKICTQCRMGIFSDCNSTESFDLSSVVYCAGIEQQPCLVGMVNSSDSTSLDGMQVMCLLNSTEYNDKEILESNGIKVTLVVREPISIPHYITSTMTTILEKPHTSKSNPSKQDVQDESLPKASLDEFVDRMAPNLLDGNELQSMPSDNDGYQAVASEIDTDIEKSLKENDTIRIEKAIDNSLGLLDDVPQVNKANSPPLMIPPNELMNSFVGPPDKRRCFDCDSHFDDDCMQGPKDIVVCKFGMGVANGCFSIYKADANQTIRGCIVENAEEILSYCRINVDLCHLCYEQQCNERVMPNFAESLKPFILNILMGIVLATYYRGTGLFVSV